MFNVSNRGGALAAGAGVIISALGLGACNRATQTDERAASTDAHAALTTSQPAQPQASTEPSHNTLAPSTPPTFSRTLRGSLSDPHDDTASNNFSRAVLDGTVTQAQYELSLKQNLAIFQCMAQVVGADQKLPEALRMHIVRDLNQVIEAFSKDLGVSPDVALGDKDILPATAGLLKLLRTQPSPHTAICAYIDLGGNAFGTHDLAEALHDQKITNTAGFTTYQREQFMELVRAMNATFTDSAQFPSYVEAGRSFYAAHGKIYASPEFEKK